jgi:hypothetical protein
MPFKKDLKIKSDFSRVIVGLSSPDTILEGMVFSVKGYLGLSKTMNAIAASTSVFATKE